MFCEVWFPSTVEPRLYKFDNDFGSQCRGRFIASDHLARVWAIIHECALELIIILWLTALIRKGIDALLTKHITFRKVVLHDVLDSAHV